MSTRQPQQQRYRETIHEPASESVTDTTDETEKDTVDTIIIHADGSYREDDDLSGAGFTLKTNAGEKFREDWQLAPNAETSMESEAAAALAAVREAKKFNPSHIVLYSDCKPVVRILDSATPVSDHRKDTYKRTRELLDTVDFTTITHIPRDRNERAHDLAHRGLREAESQTVPGGS